MRRVHIIAIDQSFMLDLAIALKEKGYEVTGSDEHISKEHQQKLQIAGIDYKEGWNAQMINRDMDCIVPAAHISANNPEMQQAKELNLQIMSITEFVYDRTKSKTRVVVTGSKGKNSLLSIIIYVLTKQKVFFDFVLRNKIPGLNKMVNFSYDSRIAIIEGDELTHSPVKKERRLSFYRPHIALISNIIWEKSEIFPKQEDYIKTFRDFVNTIERDGKFIYNELDETLKEISLNIREDVTAMPYTKHSIIEKENKLFLDTRFGQFPIGKTDDYFLENLNGARYVCRQLGIQDKDFYASISEMSLQKK